MDKIYQQKMERYSEEYVFENCEREGEVFLVKDAYQMGWHDALQNQWISVEEALPKKTQECFVKCCIGNEQYNYTSMFDSHTQRFDDCINDEVTHWMSIPELKGGEE